MNLPNFHSKPVPGPLHLAPSPLRPAPSLQAHHRDKDSTEVSKPLSNTTRHPRDGSCTGCNNTRQRAPRGTGECTRTATTWRRDAPCRPSWQRKVALTASQQQTLLALTAEAPQLAPPPCPSAAVPTSAAPPPPPQGKQAPSEHHDVTLEKIAALVAMALVRLSMSDTDECMCISSPWRRHSPCKLHRQRAVALTAS